MMAGRSSWLCHGTMPPGWTTSLRKRRRRSARLTFSWASSTWPSTLSVTSFGFISPVVRDCLSVEVLLARSLLSGAAADLAPLPRAVAEAVGVPVEGVISDGQTSIRRAVEQALPGVPHQLCQFHFLREAALPVFEADRHAKVELKKQVRGIRPI